MAQPVTVENEDLQIEVWPQYGGKVSSIIDRADGFDLLYSFPAELPPAPQYDVPYANSWHAGWDECFPAVGPGLYNRHPYDGIAVPDHGELWGLPTTSIPARNGITTVWHGLRFGYRLTRKITLEGPTMTAEYTLVNLAPFEFHFVWSMNALLSLSAPVTLELPRQEFRLSHDAEGNEHHTTFLWPAAGDGIDLSDPPSLPQRQAWKAYGNEPISGPARIDYPGRNRSVKIEFESEQGRPQAYWGIWINTGGWAGGRHFAVQPTTGRFDRVDRSIRDRSSASVDALGRADWTVRWTMGLM